MKCQMGIQFYRNVNENLPYPEYADGIALPQDELVMAMS